MAFVYKDSPSSLAGLRFGDQLLQINGANVAGWDTDKTMKVLKNAPAERITFAIRDRCVIIYIMGRAKLDVRVKHLRVDCKIIVDSCYLLNTFDIPSVNMQRSYSFKYNIVGFVIDILYKFANFKWHSTVTFLHISCIYF